MFNLPPLKTCMPSAWCLHGDNGKPMCYAMRKRSAWPNVKMGNEWRYRQSLKADFVSRMTALLSRTDKQYFRIHASGDFYSEEYVEKWVEICSACPHLIFRAPTRRRDLTEAIRKLASLKNVVIRESLDTERTEPTMGLPVAAIEGLGSAVHDGYIQCVDSCSQCGHKCWLNPERDVVFPLLL